MASYYKRIQTVISYGEEDLFHFVDSQNMKNSLYIKKLIREEMLRQAGKGITLVPSPSPTPVPRPVEPVVQETPKKEVIPPVQEPTLVQEEEKKPTSIKLNGGGVLF